MAIQAIGIVRETPGPEPVTVASLIRQLVEKVVGQSSCLAAEEYSNSQQSEEILLDIDVDDARYLLMRLPKGERLHVALSPREREIVRMVAQGHSNKVIADVLSISTWTVCTHLRRIFAKLGVGSRAAMVAQLMGTSPPARPR